ncbi:ABC transporter substrate-binding protein [Oscillospiraceae bacterium HV4-5-C5C]|nr:ABC transporter substrate-binding protein [Oscillospiraceae bacterium HV4-5-C5C]
MKRKRLLSEATALTLSLALLAGCSSAAGSSATTTAAGNDSETTAATTAAAAESSTGAASAADTTTAAESEGSSKYPDFITVDVFDSQANFQGIQSGWFAKLVKDKFNMELNIIAPNVAGGGETLFETRSANGNLGDLILTNADKDRLKDMVSAGLVMDISSYMTAETNLNQYTDAITTLNELAEQDGVWSIPSQVSLLSPTDPCEATDPTNAISLRWDLYQQIGAPEISTLEDLLPVLQQMQDAAGTSDSGQQVYAMSLFKDWDGDLMQNATALTSLYGYDNGNGGYALLNVKTGEIQSAIDSDSAYIRALKFFFEANQMGLVDPESTTQNFDNLSAKFTDGAVLYSFWPWCGSGYYNNSDHTAQGKGFESVSLTDGALVSWGNTQSGSSSFTISVGSQAQDPQRMVDFIDWLYSPEGIVCSGSQTAGAPGPEGLTWTMEDGEPQLTDFGVQVLIDKDTTAEVPEAWGGGTYADGISALNYQPVGIKDVNQENNMTYNYTLWDDYFDRTQTPLSEDYKAKTGYNTGLEYLESLGELAVVPGSSWAKPDYSTDISTIKEQCKQTIVDYSWRMAFASDEAEFNSLLQEMQDTAKGLGYDDVFAVDKSDNEARWQVFEQIRSEAD